jgi:hypothetical protein
LIANTYREDFVELRTGQSTYPRGLGERSRRRGVRSVLSRALYDWRESDGDLALLPGDERRGERDDAFVMQEYRGEEAGDVTRRETS